MTKLKPIERIESRILLIRGQKVMIDKDLAELYSVETKHLNRQVKRNLPRFPKEFMFQLTETEKQELVTNWHRFEKLKHSTSLPYVFTEHGVAMLATVLKSELAVKISILIIKVFVRSRQHHKLHDNLNKKIKELAGKVDQHESEIGLIIKTIEKMIATEAKPKPKIGFRI
jgi:hypothetical protein